MVQLGEVVDGVRKEHLIGVKRGIANTDRAGNVFGRYPLHIFRKSFVY
jgi:hypothetical protein